MSVGRRRVALMCAFFSLVLVQMSGTADAACMPGGPCIEVPSQPSSSGSGGSEPDNSRAAEAGRWIGQRIREVFGAGAAERRRARATQVNNQAVELQRAGDLDAALRLYRQALDLNGNDAVIRLNLMSMLMVVAYRDFAAAQVAHDEAGMGRVERLLEEARNTNNTTVATLADYGRVAGWQTDMQRRVEAWRSNEILLASAGRRNAEIVRDLNAPNSSRTRSEDSGSTGLAFGDPGAVQLNPGARTADAATVAAAPPRASGPTASADALGQLRNSAAGQQTTGQTFDGGGAHDDASPEAGALVAESHSAVRVFSAAELARFNASPAFREANAVVERERRAAEAAQAREAQLVARRDVSADPSARQRLQIQIAENTRELDRARSAQRIAEQQREEAIRIIEGEPIIVEGPGR